MSPTLIHRNLPRLLLQAREALMSNNRPLLRKHGLSDQQWRVLRVLGEYRTLETGRLAREAYIVGPSLTGVLGRMERKKLVRRQRDPVDQRRTVVQATVEGAKLAEKLSRCFEAYYDRVEERLGNQRLAELYALLDQLIKVEQSSSPRGG